MIRKSGYRYSEKIMLNQKLRSAMVASRSSTAPAEKSAAPASQFRLPDQPLILMGEQIALNLRHRVHGDTDHDQKRRAAKVERHRRIGNQNFRNQADDREINRSDHSDARQHVIDVFGGALARPDARNEATMLLEVVGGLGRVEHDRGIEEREEHDQREIQDQEQRAAVAEL